MKCTNCGNELSENAKFCSRCGTSAPKEAEQRKCINCGTDLSPSSKFCPKCGTAVPDTQIPAAPVAYPVQQNNMMASEPVRMTKSKTSNAVKAIIIAAIVIILAGGVFAGLYFGTDIFTGSQAPVADNEEEKKEENTCRICDDEIDEDEKYCKDCEDEYTCTECGDIDKDVKDGLCEECEAKRLACKECNHVLEEGYYCEDCINELVEDTENLYCNYCYEDLKYTDVFIIDNNGFPYCKDCDTGKYCEECGTILAEDEDDSVCYPCSDTWCYSCGEVLTEDEVFIEDYNGGTYCKDCDTGKYCEECGGMLAEDEDDSICYGCADIWCYNCGEVLTENDYYIMDTYENSYCEDCDTGYYCQDCGAPVDEDDTYCYQCE